MRCFLAVPLAQPALGDAQRLQATLRERVPDVRWSRPETLHLTVHFFGNVAGERAMAAVELVRPVASRTAAFDVTLSRLGSFPARGVPRVLWLGPAAESAPLTTLALECRRVLAGAQFDIEDRPYHAHCTLGRPRPKWSDDTRNTWASFAGQIPGATAFTASRIVLYESSTAPGGAVYTERASLGLAPR